MNTQVTAQNQDQSSTSDNSYQAYTTAFYELADKINLKLTSKEVNNVIPTVLMAMNLGSKQEIGIGFSTEDKTLIHVAKCLKTLTFRGVDFIEGLRDGRVKDTINSEPFYNCLFGIYKHPVKEPFRTDYERYRGSQGAVFISGTEFKTKYEFYVGTLDFKLDENIQIPEWKNIEPDLNEAINNFDSIRYRWVYKNRDKVKDKIKDMVEQYKPDNIDSEEFKQYALILAVASFDTEKFDDIKKFILELADKTINGDINSFKKALYTIVNKHKEYDALEYNISIQTILNKLQGNPEFSQLKQSELIKLLARLNLYVRTGMVCNGTSTKGLVVSDVVEQTAE